VQSPGGETGRRHREAMSRLLGRGPLTPRVVAGLLRHLAGWRRCAGWLRRSRGSGKACTRPANGPEGARHQVLALNAVPARLTKEDK
jgi:hypothetical protein